MSSAGENPAGLQTNGGSRLQLCFAPTLSYWGLSIILSTPILISVSVKQRYLWEIGNFDKGESEPAINRSEIKLIFFPTVLTLLQPVEKLLDEKHCYSADLGIGGWDVSEKVRNAFGTNQKMFLKQIRNVFGINFKQLLVASPVKMSAGAGF